MSTTCPRFFRCSCRRGMRTAGPPVSASLRATSKTLSVRTEPGVLRRAAGIGWGTVAGCSTAGSGCGDNPRESVGGNTELQNLWCSSAHVSQVRCSTERRSASFFSTNSLIRTLSSSKSPALYSRWGNSGTNPTGGERTVFPDASASNTGIGPPSNNAGTSRQSMVW